MNWSFAAASLAVKELDLLGTHCSVANYWLSLWKDNTPPTFSTFDPSRIREAIAGLSIFEVRSDDQVTCRFAGAAYKFFFGFDIVGRNWIELTPPGERQLRQARIRTIVGGAVCLGRRRAPDRVPDQELFCDLNLPLAPAELGAPYHFLVYADWRPTESESRIRRSRSATRATAETFRAISIESPPRDLSSIESVPLFLDQIETQKSGQDRPLNSREDILPRFGGETVLIVDDDPAMLELMTLQLTAAGLRVASFGSARDLLDHGQESALCIISDVRMSGMDGLALQRELKERKSRLPFVIVTAHGDIPLAVTAVKGGAVDIIEKPFTPLRLLSAVDQALALKAQWERTDSVREGAASRLTELTVREHEILELLVDGKQSKTIAGVFDISQRTVEVHRANIMRKLEVKTIGELVRLALSARTTSDEESGVSFHSAEGA